MGGLIMLSRISLISTILVLFIISCERDSGVIAPPGNSGDDASVSFYFEKPSSLDSLVVFANAMVSASDMDTILVDLTVMPNMVTGTIDNIPAGLNRKFEIFTYDADTVLTYSGHAFADVPAGAILTLQIVLYPVNTTGTVIIVGTFSPFPPTDEKIVFRADYTGNYDLYIMDDNANNILNLTNTPGVDERYARISPDRQKIVFNRYENGFHRPYMMNIDGSNVVALDIFPGYNVGYLDWSPGGDKLVLFANSDGDDEIYTYDFNSGQTNQITFNHVQDWVPHWSPTGEWIAYQSREAGVFKIFLIHPDGSGKHELLGNSGLEEKYPAFSPDGNKILFYARDYVNWDLFVVDVNGTNLTRLTSTPAVDENYGCWAPDQHKILFTMTNSSTQGLYLYDINTGAITQLLDDQNHIETFSHWR